MTPLPDFGSTVLRPEYSEAGGVFFTPSNTAKQNYFYLQCAGGLSVEKGFVADHREAESYLLLYSYSGTGELSYLDRHYSVGPNEGFLIDCRQTYSYRNSEDENWDFVWFNLYGESFGTYYNQFSSARKPTFQAREGSALEMFIGKLASQCASATGSPQSELIASTTIVNILTELILSDSDHTEDRRKAPGYITGIMERINADFTRPITLDALAQEFNVSKYHLSREFKKYTGYSPNEYVISMRINRAKELLRSTSITVGEIAQMTGCGDVNHFIQLFKSREKTTPSAFRKHWHNK